MRLLFLLYMHIAYPYFLYSLLLLSIPILIHLWNLRKAKIAYFSNVAMLRQIEVVSKRRNKLRNLLLLSLRMLFMVFLTVAFAKWYFSDIQTGDQKLKTNFVFDLSCSVLSNPENQEIFKQIIQKTDQDAKALASISLASCQNNASSWYKSDNPFGKSEEIILSDFQKGNYDADFLDFKSKQILVPLPSPKLDANVFIDSLWLEDNYFKKGFTNDLNVQIQNSGVKNLDQVLIELKVNTKTVASQMVACTAGSKKQLHFYIPGEGLEALHCQIKIDDGAWVFDNIFDFVLTPVNRIPISLLSNNPNDPIKIAYDQEGSFQCQIIGENKINSLAAPALYIVAIEKLNKTLLLNLIDLAKKGSTLVFLSSSAWEQDLYDILSKQTGSSLTKLKETKVAEVATLDEKNPFFKNIFDQSPGQSQLPTAVPIVSQSATGMVLLRFKSGAPALTEHELGNGKMYLFSFGLDANQTFSSHALFLPVFYRIAEKSARNTLPTYVRADQKSMEFLPVERSEAQFFTLKSVNAEITPDQKNASGKAILFLPTDLTSGPWTILDKNKKTVGAFGYNVSKRESQLSFFSVNELRERFSGNPQVQVMEFSQFKNDYLQRGNNQASDNTWSYAVGISFIFLLAEIIASKYLGSASYSSPKLS